MPTYFYTAKDKLGNAKVGTIEAPDQHELANILRTKGFLLISAKTMEAEKKEGNAIVQKILSYVNRITSVDKIMFTRHLSMMIKAGLSLNQALKALAKQSKNPKFKRIILQIEKDVRQGQQLSASLAKYPKIFNELYIGMVQVGEASGNLDLVLNNIAQQMKKDHDLVSRVKGAMVYPIVVITAMVGIGAGMMIMIVPKISEVFVELEMDLPISTQIVVGVSNFLKDHYIIGLILIVAFIILIKLLLKYRVTKRLFHRGILYIPIIGNLIKKINSARFARTFSSLIESGVDIVKALKIVANTLGNIHFKEVLVTAANQVQKGNSLSKTLQPYENVYPAMVIEMVQVGEETGDISGILKKLADFYEEEVDNITKNLSSIIEPILMIIVGAAVGFFAISMLQPIYSMMQGL